MKSKSHQSYYFNATIQNFEKKVIKESFNRPVLVDFWAKWCRPCNAIDASLEKIIKENGHSVVLAKVNIDQQGQLKDMFGISSIPALRLISHGKIVMQHTGSVPLATLQKKLNPFLAKHKENKR